MVDWKTQRSPLLPSIPTENEFEDFERLVKWRRSMLDVITLFAANVYDDIRKGIGGTNNSTTVNLTVSNYILSASVNAAGIYLDTLAAPIYSNGRLDSTSLLHGLCPKLSGNALEYLSGTGGWSVPAGGNGNGANHVPASVTDSSTIDFTIDSANQVISGNVIKANIKLDELGAPTNVTTLNANATTHGLLPRLSNNATEFLAGDGSWAVPGGGANSNHAPVTIVDTTTVNLVIAANQELTAYVKPTGIPLDDLGTPANGTDLDANTSRHGLLKRLSGNANEYLSGNGAWSVPPGNANHQFGSFAVDSYVNGTSYNAITDGLVVAFGSTTGISGYTPANANYYVAHMNTNGAGNQYLCVTFPVSKGSSWKVLYNDAANANYSISFMPIGS